MKSGNSYGLLFRTEFVLFMRRNIFVYLFLVFILPKSLCFGQQPKDTINLMQVNITGLKSINIDNHDAGMVWDSSVINKYSGDNMGSLLKKSSIVNIKDYGPGGIATISVRGTAATQNSVLWNGFNINSPNLGLCDLSIVPSNIADYISLYNESSNMVNGTSALGGVLVLAFKPVFNKQTSISIQGNYKEGENYHSDISIATGGKKVYSRSQVFYDYHNNHFRFINTAKKGYPESIQKHARLINYGFVEQLSFSFNKNWQLDAALWYQVTTRQQPPSMTVQHSEAVLGDSIFRGVIGFSKQFLKLKINAKVAYFDENEKYDDPFHRIYSTYKVKSYKASLHTEIDLRPGLIVEMGSSININSAEITEYKKAVLDKRFLFYEEIKYRPYSFLTIFGKMRQELADGHNLPLIPSGGIIVYLFQHLLTIKVNGGQQYNLPSLNDKYWQPGGNIYLKPEMGWSSDVTSEFALGKKRNLHFSLCTFQKKVDNWIQWYPIDSSGIYKAVNLRKVKSSGFEGNLKYHLAFSQIQFDLTGAFSYTRVINESFDDINGEPYVGKQLIYVPFVNSLLGVEINYKRFAFFYRHSWCSKQYTRADNKEQLPAFMIGDLYVSKNFALHSHSLRVYIKINNLWNEQYQQIKWFAMPLRTLEGGFTLNFNNSNNKNQKK